MFLDDQSKSDDHIHLLSSTLKQNIIKQAASMLLQHLTFQKNFYHLTQNNNTNAFDEHHHIRRTNKCNSWLSKFSNTSQNQLNESSLYKPKSRNYSSFYPSNKTPLRFHHNPLTLSSNAAAYIYNDMNPQLETFSQPLIMIHKKRLRRDYFLSTMQNCIQPPYSQNHFYAFDQLNMLKLQRNFHRNNYLNSKRKYSEIYNDDDDDDEPEYISSEIDLLLSKKPIISPPKTADHISINKYHDELIDPFISDDKPEIDLSIEKQQSERILSRLEKILNLCGELRSLANDVENHLNEKQTILLDINEKNPIEKPESEPTIIDIYKEFEIQQVINDINEKNALPLYQTTNDITSIHSESNKSYQLMQTESFKTKSPSLTTLRQPEDICSCFLKRFFEKENCQLNTNEQEYLNQLTKAYLLGREQILKEQHEENNKFQAFINENLPENQNEFDNSSSSIFHTNNNNQSMTPISPSSILLYNNCPKLDEHLSSIPLKSNDSINSLNEQQSSIRSGVITVKHQIFINAPIAMKTTNVLPGIGSKYAQQLAECGFSTVRRLLGFYLMIKDDQNFVNWLNNKVQISIHSAWLCTNALRAWCQAHL